MHHVRGRPGLETEDRPSVSKVVGELRTFPSSLKPMLATPVDKPFSDPDWLFEPKLDGFRVLAYIRQGERPNHAVRCRHCSRC